MRQHHRAKVELQMAPSGLVPANFLRAHAHRGLCGPRSPSAAAKGRR